MSKRLVHQYWLRVYYYSILIVLPTIEQPAPYEQRVRAGSTSIRRYYATSREIHLYAFTIMLVAIAVPVVSTTLCSTVSDSVNAVDSMLACSEQSCIQLLILYTLSVIYIIDIYTSKGDSPRLSNGQFSQHFSQQPVVSLPQI